MIDIREYINNGKAFDGKYRLIRPLSTSGGTADVWLALDLNTVKEVVTRYVVDINDVACTILYPGTTLSSISMQYDIPKDLLLEFNEVVVEEELHEDDIIFLDKKKKKYTGPKDFYTAREGDSLYGVSQQFGIKVTSLAKMNRMEVSEKLHPGDKLKLK